MSVEHVVTTEGTETLEVIREEQCSPALSSANIDAPKADAKNEPCAECTCLERDEKLKEKMDPDLVRTLLNEKEKRLTDDFQDHLKKEITLLRDRCDFILQNEQVRASYMLREAHRERQEKIAALQTQLECKNLAGLMYVMCTERRKSKLEKMRLIEEYTNYIHALQDILTDAQSLILHLSRGYKTATRVDHEWREKMRKVITEFQMFVHDFAGGVPEANQYFFDVPALLKTKAPIVDNPDEDPCEPEQEEEEEEHDDSDQEEKPWWERMDAECRPFLMFGDMAEFKPPQRREVLHTLKATKTAPRKWKEYVFNEMFIKADCVNANVIKDEYPKHIPTAKWECQPHAERESSKLSLASRRATRASEDYRGNMGSILKIMTSNNLNQPVTKATLLGARDSMEIASTTKLREKHKVSDHSKVIININNSHARRTSFFDGIRNEDLEDFDDIPERSNRHSKNDEEDAPDELSALGSIHNDSLQVINNHVPDQDHRINYEKVCPMDKCQRLQVDSFIRSLPPYMRSNPFTHFEQNYEEYETCSPEQIEILKKRIEQKKAKSEHEVIEESPLAEWTESVEGVAIQTSELSVSLPPCNCRVPSPTPVSSNGQIFNVQDLIPVKQALDMINKECLYDDRIEFDRFKVLGQESLSSMQNKPMKNINRSKVQEITTVLKQHPSLLDIFQANTQC